MSTEFYDRSAVYYDTVRGITDSNLAEVTHFLEGERILALFRQFGYNQTKYFLDLGCGTGNLCCYLGFLGYKVKGIDLSEGMLGQAVRKKQFFGLQNIDFLNHDAATLTPSELAADTGIIYSKELFNNILKEDEFRSILNNLFTLSSPGTLLLIEAYTELGIGFLIDKVEKEFPEFHYSQQGSYDQRNRSGVVRYGFKGKDCTATELVLPVRYWDKNDFESAIAAAGFRKIEFFDSNVTISLGAETPSVSFSPVSFLSEMFMVKAQKLCFLAVTMTLGTAII